ncbi:DNA-binding domain-containing protein [Erwinia papayae]|uniref:DNA-binding domain-containing protein n=1 Tax=Erwinia papayae TaxID=206499 RepID=A0ABV3N706_9GAMM
MFNKLKKTFNRRSFITESASSEKHNADCGYIQPLNSDEIYLSVLRKKNLNLIKQSLSLPTDIAESFCFSPLNELLLQTQSIPAVPTGKWDYKGAFGDLTLIFISHVVRLAKGFTFPPGAAPEEQSKQNLVWNAVLFWSALFYHLPLCSRIEGELDDGKRWQPGLSVPARPFRVRFYSPCREWVESFAVLSAGRLLTSQAVEWLSDTPLALHNVAYSIRNHHPEMQLLQKLLNEAAAIAESPLQHDIETTLSKESGSQAELLTSSFDYLKNKENVTNESLTATDFTLATSLEGVSAEFAENPENKPCDINPSEKDDDNNTETDSLLSLFDEVNNTEDATNPPTNETHPGTVDFTESVTDVPVIQKGMDHDYSGDALSDPGLKSPSPPDIPDGQEFMNWLSKGINSGELSFNEQPDKIHTISGYIFLPVPGIFFEFLKARGENANARESLQLSFERLNIHKRHDKKRFYYVLIHDEPERKGKFRREKGYLVKGKSVFHQKVPADSLYISVP